ARLSASRSVDFESLFPEEATKLEIIVTFLAVLELMKVRAIQAFQGEQFGTIIVSLAVQGGAWVSMRLLEQDEQPPRKGEWGRRGGGGGEGGGGVGGG